MNCAKLLLGHDDLSSLIVDDLNIECIAVAIAEADSPLVVDPDTPLPGAIPAQRLEAIRRRHAQILDPGRSIQLNQAHRRSLANLGRITARLPIFPEALRLAVGEASNHERQRKQIVYTCQQPAGRGLPRRITPPRGAAVFRRARRRRGRCPAGTRGHCSSVAVAAIRSESETSAGRNMSGPPGCGCRGVFECVDAAI